MRRGLTLATALVTLGIATNGAAQSPSTSAITSGAPPSTTAPAPLPVGHPPLDENEIPPGHPAVGGNGMPAGHPGVDDEADVDEAGFPKIPQNQSNDDPSLASGALEIQILDETDHPVPNVEVEMEVTHQSVAQGDTKTNDRYTTDARGIVSLRDLKSGSSWLYRVSVKNADPDDRSKVATFSVPTFALSLERGHRVFLHRFPVSGTLSQKTLVFAGVVAEIEVRDDAIAVHEQVELANFGLTAWALGDGLDFTLPPGSKGVRGAEGDGDIRVDEIEGKAARFKGTVPPGGLVTGFDFQIPYDGDASVTFTLGLFSKRTVSTSVRVAARRGMTLSVDGLPDAKMETGIFGIHVLTADKPMQAFDPQHPIDALTIHIGGLPSQGAAKWVVTSAGILAVAIGIVLALMTTDVDPKRLAAARKRAKGEALDELVALERAHRNDEIGPNAYERERAKLIDRLAEVVEQDDAVEPKLAVDAPKKKKKKKRAAGA